MSTTSGKTFKFFANGYGTDMGAACVRGPGRGPGRLLPPLRQSDALKKLAADSSSPSNADSSSPGQESIVFATTQQVAHSTRRSRFPDQDWIAFSDGTPGAPHKAPLMGAVDKLCGGTTVL